MDFLSKRDIENRIFTHRGVQVMLDSDLAELYQVEVKVLNQTVRRNLNRFPESFRFKLEENDFQILKSSRENLAHSLRSQIVTLKNGRGKHRKYLPYAFTEQGVAMLSGVLRSEIAVQVSIQIMQAFISMRKFLLQNASVFQRLDSLELSNCKPMEKLSGFSRHWKRVNQLQTRGYSLMGRFLTRIHL